MLNEITVKKLRETVLFPGISTPATLVVVLVVWLAGFIGLNVAANNVVIIDFIIISMIGRCETYK